MAGKQRFADWVRDHTIAADTLDPLSPLDDLEPLRELIGDACIVVASHNIHIQKTPLSHGALGLLAQGYHLAQALANDYLAIAATSTTGRTARMQIDPAQVLGFAVQDRPLSPVAEGSVEAAFRTEAPLAIADLRAAGPGVHDAVSFQRMRMEDYFLDVSVFDAFDALASIPDTRCTEYVSAQADSPNRARCD
jgi:erythromycin esterase